MRKRERVYPNFVARIVQAAPAAGWKVAVFVRDGNGQELPLPPQGILVESPNGILRAVVRPVNSRTLNVTYLSTQVGFINSHVSGVLPVRERIAAVLGDLEEQCHRIELKSGRRAALRWYWKQVILSLPFLLARSLRR